MEKLLISRVLADGIRCLIAHITGLLDHLVRHDLLQRSRTRAIALCCAHLVSSLILSLMNNDVVWSLSPCTLVNVTV